MTHPNFLMGLWYRFLLQEDITLNVVQPCRMNPIMLAHISLEGEFDYNKTLLVLLGFLVIEGVTPDNRDLWDPHGTKV